MKSAEKYILMFKNHKVLSFSVTFNAFKATFLEKLKYFNEAPYGMNDKDADLNLLLLRFFNLRSIAPQRWDYDQILKATGCKSEYDLLFRGHGLSLSDHYWFKKESENLKYEDINFFTNKWDDSFARAVLKRDYDALKDCDLNIPDVATAGWGVKCWIYDNGPKLYKLGIVKDAYEDCLGEVLASKLAQRLLGKEEVVNYELAKVGDGFASICPLITGIDEELIPLQHVLPPELYGLYSLRNANKNKNKEFLNKISEFDIPGLYERFIKLSVLRTLGFISDIHFGNISIIRNKKTGTIRLAPIYDLAGAFGSSKTGKEYVSKIDKGGYFIIYFLFSNLEPDCDYSWYDPKRLEGFEKDIKNILSKSSFYTPEMIEKIIAVYHQQKDYLDSVAKH